MIAEIIGVTSRVRDLDAEAQMFAREVALLGVDLHYQTIVGDDRMRLAQAMAQALRRSDIIITAGGIGPEAGDFTKEVICQGLSLPMDLHNESYQRIRAWHEAAGLPVPPGAQKAAMLPRGGVVFPGEDGGAPGVAVAAGDQCILMLPGAPDALLPMFMNSVVPFLAKFAGATIVSRAARLFGVEEREAMQKLFDLQNSRNPSMTVYTHKGEVLVRVTARANNRQQAANMCTPFLKEIVGRLGDFVYGIDVENLESVVVTHLTQKGLRLAAAESGTAGLLTQRLNLIPGAGNVFKFGLSAKADRVKVQSLKVPEKLIRKFGSVSDRVAVHMACGAMDAGDADIGLALTGLAGAEAGGPAGLCYIAACTKNQVVVKQLSLPPDMPVAEQRQAAVGHALNLVRLMLDYDPEPCPGAIPLSAALKGKIDLCDDAPPLEALDGGEAPRRTAKARREGGGADVRTIIMVALIVVLIGALGFIGYALYQRFLPDGLPFSFGGSSSESTSSESSEEESGSSEDEDSEPVSTGPVGPAIGGQKKEPSEEDEEDSGEDEPPAGDAPSSSDVQSMAQTPPSSSAAPVKDLTAAPSSSSAPASSSAPPAPSSSAPPPPSSTAPAPSSSREEPSVSSVSSASSETERMVLKPGMVYNVHTGKFSYNSTPATSDEDEEDEDPFDLTVVDLDEDDYKDPHESDSESSGGSDYSADEEITVLGNGKNVTAPIQEIVERIVQVEMGASFEKEALRAQAVAAYTYVEYALARGQKPNVALSSKSDVSTKVASAVADVIGEEVLYNGKVINATYFASCAGVTNDSEDVWSDALPYLRSVDSDENVPEKTVRISASRMRSAIEDALDFDPEDYSDDPDDWITDVTYCDNREYVDEIEFCGKKSKPGAWVRANMLTSLNSHAFEVEFDGNDFVFYVRGAGHGVGMSQLGAQQMAKDGYSYDEILEHYYTGARVR